MYSRRTEVKVVRRGESSGERVVGGEGVGAGGGFIVVVVDQKTSFGYDFSTDHLTTTVSSFSYLEPTEQEHSKLGFTPKFREKGMAQSGAQLSWFDLPQPERVGPSRFLLYLKIPGANRGIEESLRESTFSVIFFTWDLTLHVSDSLK